jgi:hypothetical protein
MLKSAYVVFNHVNGFVCPVNSAGQKAYLESQEAFSIYILQRFKVMVITGLLA